MALSPGPLSAATHTSLAVLLHAFRKTPRHLDDVAAVVRDKKPASHVIAPALPLRMCSRANLTKVARTSSRSSTNRSRHRANQKWAPFDKILLIGHSTGSMISRKAYIIACGETEEARSHIAIALHRSLWKRAGRGADR